jgi:hypothetical protein
MGLVEALASSLWESKLYGAAFALAQWRRARPRNLRAAGRSNR